MNNIEIQKLEELLKTVFDFTKKQSQILILSNFDISCFQEGLIGKFNLYSTFLNHQVKI